MQCELYHCNCISQNRFADPHLGVLSIVAILSQGPFFFLKVHQVLKARTTYISHIVIVNITATVFRRIVGEIPGRVILFFYKRGIVTQQSRSEFSPTTVSVKLNLTGPRFPPISCCCCGLLGALLLFFQLSKFVWDLTV